MISYCCVFQHYREWLSPLVGDSATTISETKIETFIKEYLQVFYFPTLNIMKQKNTHWTEISKKIFYIPMINTYKNPHEFWL